jgi:thiamine biosynthesis lipoprotein
MRCGKRAGAAVLAAAICSTVLAAGTTPSFVHRQRYSMGTTFDIVAVHEPGAEVERAIASALDEIERLDRVLSHYRDDSDLARLLREEPDRFVRVDPSLYDVLSTALLVSARSNGRFDVTIAPVLKAWQRARALGRAPSAAEIADAQQCVGYQRVRLAPPDRVRLGSGCLDIDLGGIGKGYAVERAIAVLAAAGIRHAVVNAGSSSIAAIGHPPGRSGWLVEIGHGTPAARTIELRNQSLSTSRQALVSFDSDAPSFGEILDVRTGAPIDGKLSVTVVAPGATMADALSTTLLLMTTDEGAELLTHFDGASALWTSAQGETIRAWGASSMQLAGKR